jgi:hypothetical protein
MLDLLVDVFAVMSFSDSVPMSPAIAFGVPLACQSLLTRKGFADQVHKFAIGGFFLFQSFGEADNDFVLLVVYFDQIFHCFILLNCCHSKVVE